MTNSREQQSNEIKSQLTTDNVSTKHTFDHQSQRSGGLALLPKKPSQEEAQSEKHGDQSEDLDKTANIIALQQLEIGQGKRGSPIKKAEAQKILQQSAKSSQKPSAIAKPALTLEIDSESPIPKAIKSPSKEQGKAANGSVFQKRVVETSKEDFEISFVKKVPLTVRGSIGGVFKFDLNATDEEEEAIKD